MPIRLLAHYVISISLLSLAGCASNSTPQPTEQVPFPAKTQTEQNIGNFQFEAHLTKELVLSGHLPDEAAQSSLMSLASSMFPGTEIIDEMNSDGVSVSGWHRTTRWGLSSLSKLEEGKLIIVDHTLHLEGRAAAAEIKAGVEAATIGLKAEIRPTLHITVE